MFKNNTCVCIREKGKWLYEEALYIAECQELKKKQTKQKQKSEKHTLSVVLRVG